MKGDKVKRQPSSSRISRRSSGNLDTSPRKIIQTKVAKTTAITLENVDNNEFQFNLYDNDGLDELSLNQIRNYLQNQHKLYLTDEKIQNIMLNVLMQNDTIKLNDFKILVEYIEKNKEELQSLSSKNNDPIHRHEDGLLFQQEKQKRDIERNYNEKTFITEVQNDQ